MKRKTILISGGTSGIGRAAALAMLDAGWNVAVFTNDPAQDKAFETELKGTYDRKRYQVLEGDITRDSSMRQVVQAVIKKFGRIDVLFNNAGIGYFEEADKVDLQKFETMVEVNVVGMARLVKLVLPGMKKQKGGQVINMASTAGQVGHAKSEFYAATKSAVLRYSEGLRAEVVKHRIKVATLCPATVHTGFWSKKEFARRKRELWGGKDPVWLTPEDIGRLVRFLCDQPDHVHIQDITVTPI